MSRLILVTQPLTWWTGEIDGGETETASVWTLAVS